MAGLGWSVESVIQKHGLGGSRLEGENKRKMSETNSHEL